MRMATFSNGAPMSSSLSTAASRSMVLDKYNLLVRLICICRGTSKAQAVPCCPSGCSSRSISLDHRDGMGSNQVARWTVPLCSMCSHPRWTVTIFLIPLDSLPSRRMTLTANLSFAGVLSCSRALTGMPLGPPMQSSRNLTIFRTMFTVVLSYVIKLGTPLVRPIPLSSAASIPRSDQACSSTMRWI